MLFPWLSVTSIGLVAGGIVAAELGHPIGPLGIGIFGDDSGSSPAPLSVFRIDVAIGSGI